MIRKAFHLAATAALLLASERGLAAGAQLRAAHLSATGSSAQLTLDVSGSTAQKIFTLEKPSRAVIDLPRTRIAPGFHLPDAAGVVTDIRTGHPIGSTVRIVVRLRGATAARSTWVTSRTGRRQLIVSFGDATSEAAAQSAAYSGPNDRGSADRGPIDRGPIDRGRTDRSPAVGGPGESPRIIRAAHAPSADTERDVIIAVDAGHGGQDPGATGPSGTHEKDVVLPIARTLAERINREPGMRAVLTRNRDEFLVLRDRIRRARVAKADMFISVHADSIANHDVTGASVYVLSERGASSEAARWLAERENAADLMGGVSLDDKDNTLASVLLDLSQSANISASMTAAQRVLTALDEVGQVRKSQVQQAGFVVLKSPDIPSMLVETAYISNPAEELRLRNPRQQSSLANAIYAGVRNYFEQNPPAGTRFAQSRRTTVATVMA